MNQKTHHYNKNNLNDTKFENLVMKKLGLPFTKLVELVGEYKANQFLNEYRGALSLWAEHRDDTKSKIIVTLDGRDGAGKGSNIKRVTEYLDPRVYDVKAFGIPKPEEKFEYNWFERYKKYFPEEGGITFFDRSWYNRAGVEAAMGFCTDEEYNWFMEHVSDFEKDDIIDEGIKFVKVYLSITKDTQKYRLEQRESARKRWKSSIIDKQAQEKWGYYTLAKAKILELTDSEHAPWTVLDSNEKFLSAVEIIKAIIRTDDEVSRIISKDLSLDLSPNRKIVRTSMEELKLMEKRGDLKGMKKEFKFSK